MRVEPDDDRWLPLAQAVAEEQPVAWDRALQEATTTADASVVEALRTLQRIIAARHRDPEAPAPDPVQWAHLIVLEKIGEGAFGAVYRARDNRLATDVALKLLRPRRDADAVNADRVLKEARLMARVRHPNVATVYGADHTQDRVGFWMELVNGRTLDDIVKSQGPFSAAEATSMAIDLCRALAAVHHAGLLHGDIKAHNVMREAGGRIVLMDFGAGNDLADGDQAGAHVAGTPVYLAPEVLQGQPRTTASDIYSLGVLLYFLVTGRYPVYAPTKTAIVRSHQQDARTRLRDARPDLSDRFIDVVESATAADPRNRYESAGAFEAALRTIEARRGRFDRTAAILFAAVFIAIVAAAMLWMMRPAPGVPVQPSGVASQSDADRGGGAAKPVAAPRAVARATTPYRIEVAFYSQDATGRHRLRPGDRVWLGGRLLLSVQSSVPTYLYVVNEDDRGGSFLMFPVRDRSIVNPLPAGEPVQLPRNYYWQVSTLGGHEHFVVFASPERQEAFEQVIDTLPTPREGEPLDHTPLPRDFMDRLRSVGGLVPAGPAAGGRSLGLSKHFSTPLPAAPETVSGLWVRTMTLASAGR
jgi:hypothetical protein